MEYLNTHSLNQRYQRQVLYTLEAIKRKPIGGVCMQYEEPELRDIEEFSRGCSTGECCGGQL
jgi:hypothetical protein